MSKTTIAKQNRKRGKNIERAIAKQVDGKRVGVLGKEDISHSLFSIESKGRKKFVATSWIEQAYKNAPKDKDGNLLKIPCIVVHVHHQRYDNAIVGIELKYWKLIQKKLAQFGINTIKDLMEDIKNE